MKHPGRGRRNKLLRIDKRRQVAKVGHEVTKVEEAGLMAHHTCSWKTQRLKAH